MVNLANLNYAVLQYEQAEAEYLEAITIYRKLAETSPEAYEPDLGRKINEYAYLYFYQEQYDRAHKIIDEAIEHCPDNPHFLDSKGEFYLKQGRNEEALAMWNRVVGLDPEFNQHIDSALYAGLKEIGLVQ